MFFILKNVGQFLRHSKVIFAVFVICEITSLMLMIFSFGVYQNYSQQIKDVASNEPIDDEKDWLSFDFDSDIDEDTPVSNETVSAFLSDLGNALGNKIGNVGFCCGDYYFNLDYNDGWEMYDMSKNFKANGMWYSGRFFSKSDYENAARVCVAPIECYKEIDEEIGYDDGRSPEDYSCRAYDKDGKIYVDLPEGSFEVIGFTKDYGGGYIIPYTVMPTDTEVTSFPTVQIKQILYQNEYNSAVNIFKEYFGNRIGDEDLSDMPVYDIEVLKTFKTKMTVCVAVAIISSINIAALFKYVVDLRRKQMAVFRINGCTQNRLRRMMTGEIMLYSLINGVVCVTCFQLLILPKITGIFPYISLAYSAKSYAVLMLIYFAVTYLLQNLMIIFSISRSPLQMLKTRR
jgi:hypothetical protein